MVHKFQDLTTGLRHQVATTSAERDRLRSELMNRSNLLKQHSRKVPSHHHRPTPNVKELKILARIHRRLIDLKMSTAANKNDIQEDDEQNEHLPTS